MKKIIFKEGDVVGRLTIIEISQEWRTKKNGHKAGKPANVLKCKCDCGNIIFIDQQHIHGKRNCGCRYGNTRYIGANKRLYTTWRSMKSRCFWEDCPNYNNYGGRGITVCEGMLDFNKYQLVVGEPPSKKHSVDRIDNDMNYSCGECGQCKVNGWLKNVRWATSKVQAGNKRNNILVEVNGESMALREACLIKGLPYKQIHERIVRGGWDKQVAINTPINKFYRYKQNRNDTSYRKKHRQV